MRTRAFRSDTRSHARAYELRLRTMRSSFGEPPGLVSLLFGRCSTANNTVYYPFPPFRPDTNVHSHCPRLGVRLIQITFFGCICSKQACFRFICTHLLQ